MSSPKIYSPLGSAASMPNGGEQAMYPPMSTGAEGYPSQTATATPIPLPEHKHTPKAATGLPPSVNPTSSDNNNRNKENTAGAWVRARVSATRRSRVFWLFGALLAFVWTIAIFAHAVNTSDYWCYGGICYDGSYAASTLGWVVLAFALIGLVCGFAIAYQFSDRSIGAWMRIYDKKPAASSGGNVNDPNHNHGSTTGSGDIEQGNGTGEGLLSPRSERSHGNVVKSIIIALFPFGIISTIVGVWFGFQIGGVASILTYNSAMDKWAFSICIFAMLITTPTFAVLSWLDQLAPTLSRLDDALLDWSSNDGLAPLGKFIVGYARGIAISGWFALLGVLIGTAIGLPASLLGGIGVAILILALVIVIIAVWYFHKRSSTPPSSPRTSNAAASVAGASGSAVPPSDGHNNNNNNGGLQTVTITPSYEVPHVTQPQAMVSASPRHAIGSPHNDNGAIQISGSINNTSDAEVLYLRGLAMLHGTPTHAKDPSMASSLIMQSANLGYKPAQDHLRQLLMNDSSSSSSTAAATVAPHPAYAVHPSA